MSIEFEEHLNKPINKPGAPVFSPNGRYLGKAPAVKENKEYGFIIGLLLKSRITKDEDHAKFILFLIIIIALGLTAFYGTKIYQALNPNNINTAPIELGLIEK
jgi:hypothetical protein